MLTYKIAFLSDCWTSRVISKVVRDIMTVQRMARGSDIMLIVAANRDISNVLKGLLNVKTTRDTSGCEIYRLYVDNSVERDPSDPEPESVMPEGVDYDTIEVVPHPAYQSMLHIDKDPYAGVKLADRFERIPSVIDKVRTAPKPVPNEELPWFPGMGGPFGL